MRFLSCFLCVVLALAGRGQDTCDVSLSIHSPTCPDDNDGSITVVAGTPGQYSYTWPHNAALHGPTAAGLTTGPYTVYVSDTSGCTAELAGVVEPPYVAPLGTMTTINISCAGNNDGSVTFTVNPGPYTWRWIDDPTLTATTRTGLGPGDYTVVVNGGVCPSYITGYLGDPDVHIEGQSTYCLSDLPLLTTALDWGFQPDIYLWSTGATTTSIQVVPGMSGLITVTATDTSIGCTASGDFTLTELPSPAVAFDAPDSVCIRLGITPEVTLSADSLVWRWGTSGFSTDSAVVMVFDEPFWQPISLQGFDAVGCGSLPVEDSTFVRPRIPAIFAPQQIPCTGSVELWLGSAADSCAFFVGDSLVINACMGWFRLDLDRYQPYDLTFYSTQPDRCDDTASFTIDMIEEPRLYLPNAFTPNGDDINDTWPGLVDRNIPEQGFEIRLFDRWGHLVWTTNDPQGAWDGASLPTGVYGYTMRMQDPCKPTDDIERNGFVTLFR